ncbi:MAG: IgGFc-binding protein [Deltaproteobacteria bacterium]|nr:IgGFc-binding protein [Deltaproteobacteria bacterium]
MMHRIAGFLCLVVWLPLAACSPSDDDVVVRDDGGTYDDGLDIPEVVSCTPGQVTCAGNTRLTCNAAGNGWDSLTCVAPTPACAIGIGCVACTPGVGGCEGSTARRCRPDGSGWDVIDECDPAAGERCSLGYCTDLSEACEAARTANSYEGCDYWPVQLANAGLEDTATFRYALVIGNRQGTAANVEVFNRGGVVATTSVPPDSIRTLEIDWNDALRSATGSEFVANGAFRVKSDVPVTVYQFNPLKYWGGSGSLGEGSYSNDASLLLPRHVLTGDYIVASRPTFMLSFSDWLSEEFSGSSGIFSIVAVEDGTEVDVSFHGKTQPGASVSGYNRGSTERFFLDKYDVLQILSEVPDSCTPAWTEPHPADPSVTMGYCDMGVEYDLTGTEIHANKPVAVYGGHDCTFIPFDRWACDHLEEQLFPLQAWGNRYLAARTQPVADEANLWRVISGADGNRIRFNPPVHGEETLSRTDWFEFESRDDFEVTADGAFLLVGFLVGQGNNLDSIGDPAMALAVPVEQYRLSYNFLAPEDYRDDPSTGATGQNYVNVIAPAGAVVTFDGISLGGFTPIGGSGFGVLRHEIGGGSHTIGSTSEFGITCYGYGNYTSYMYPGGLDVDIINII